jgi:heat shock protein HtpX
MNVLRTVFLLTLLTMILVWLGNHFGGRSGMIIALVIGLGLNFVNYWFSGSIVLKVHGARIVGPGEAPALEQDVREMAERAGIPMPRIAISPNPAPNAFATGRNPAHAVVAVTEGLLRVCDRRQVRAVIGHELGHVKNRDMLTMTLVSGAVSAISMLAHMAGWFGSRDRGREGGFGLALVAMFVAPLVAFFVQMAISRTREYAADDAGARLSGDPGALADALENLHRAIPNAPPMMDRGSATAHLMIASPFFGMGELFSTHPSPERRLARLREMAAGRRGFSA